MNVCQTLNNVKCYWMLETAIKYQINTWQAVELKKFTADLLISNYAGLKNIVIRGYMDFTTKKEVRINSLTYIARDMNS